MPCPPRSTTRKGRRAHPRRHRPHRSRRQQTTEEQIANRLDDGHSFAWVARRVTPEVAARVRALNMKGIYFQKEFQRFYPDNQIAAQVLGYVGVDDNGLGGLEQNSMRSSTAFPAACSPPWTRAAMCSDRPSTSPSPARISNSPSTTTSSSWPSRRSTTPCKRPRRTTAPSSCRTCTPAQILALAIRPTFNPNDFRHTTPALLQNHAVSDVYEPGSVFKLVTYSAALDQRVAKPDDMIDCQGGKITLAGRVIHDDQGEHYGVVTVHKALEESSDVAAVKLALKMGPDNFYKYIRDFGFGSRTGMELPGETRGLLRPPNKWGGSSIGSIAIGQEVGVTPLQLVSMVSTIANGGVYLPPRVLMPGQAGSKRRPRVRHAAGAAGVIAGVAVQGGRRTAQSASHRARIASSPR